MEAELRSYKTADEIRKEQDVDPFEEDWSKIPLNDKVIQIYQSAQMNAMGGGFPGAEDGGELPQGASAGPGAKERGQSSQNGNDFESQSSGADLHR